MRGQQNALDGHALGQRQRPHALGDRRRNVNRQLSHDAAPAARGDEVREFRIGCVAHKLVQEAARVLVLERLTFERHEVAVGGGGRGGGGRARVPEQCEVGLE